MAGKECTKCHKILPLEAFNNAKDGKYGKDSVCRECKKIIGREYRQRPEVKEHNQRYFAERYKDPEYRKAQHLNAQKPERKAQKSIYKAKYSAVNKERIAEYMREYCKDERVKQLRLEGVRRYEERHREEISARRKTEEHRKWMRQWDNQRRQQPKHKLCHRMSTRMLIALGSKKQGRSWMKYVDYSVGDLMRHLESLFRDGMSWDNMGMWHLDHIKPIAAFDFTSPDDLEFKECWSLKNLQPLWAEDNLRKGAKREVAL